MSFREDAARRYSSREFTDAKVENEKIIKILEVANMAPTATNAQPHHIWVVESEDGIEKLNKATSLLYGAKTALVVGAKKDVSWTRSEDQKNFADIDAAIVATHIWLEIYEQGLASTWVGLMDTAKMKEYFPEMKDYELVAIFPLGYPADTKAGNPSPRHTKRKDLKDTYTKL